MEKRNQQKKTIKKLIVDGKVINRNIDILNEEKKYYKNLYKSNCNSNEAKRYESIFLNSTTLPKLSEQDKNAVEGELTLSECWEALKSFENNKSPGNDGIPAEFYRAFWPDIKHLLGNSF